MQDVTDGGAAAVTDDAETLTYVPYLFGDTVAANTAAARFFYRWLALNRLGWRRERCFAVLMDDPSLTEGWRDFAQAAHMMLLAPEPTGKKNINPKTPYLQEDQHMALRDLYETSPLLTPYVRAALLDGSIEEALETLISVYNFERTLPEGSL